MDTTKQPVALITGVSREEGIGFGLAEAMARQGFIVIITARDIGQAEAQAEKLRARHFDVSGAAVDISDDESVAQLAQSVKKTYGKLDVLINNAGAPLDYGTHPLGTDIQVVKDALDVNVFGAWRMAKHFHSLLQQSPHPRIVNISSGAGSFGDPVFGLGVHQAIVTAYGISKLALNGFTVKLARELKEEGILVNSVCPGFVATAPGMEKMGARPVSESVDGIVWAATLPDDGPTGGFFRDRKPLSW